MHHYNLAAMLAAAGVIAPANDYSTSKVCSTHLNAFGAARAAIAGVDAYHLFTGVNLDGLVSGQEIAHNWGEPCHPHDKNAAGKYNIMATGTDHDKRAFWFTSGASDKSADRVKTATARRL